MTLKNITNNIGSIIIDNVDDIDPIDILEIDDMFDIDYDELDKNNELESKILKLAKEFKILD